MKKKIKKRPILVVMYASYILMTLAGLLLIYGVLKISNVENIIRYLSCFLIFLVLIYTFLSCIKVTLRGKNALIIIFIYKSAAASMPEAMVQLMKKKQPILVYRLCSTL